VEKEALALGTDTILRVAISAPLRRLFDYLPAAGGKPAVPGGRVRVPFGRTSQVGIVAELANSSELPVSRLRRVQQVIDTAPLLQEADIALLRWAARYYAHPVGDVFAAALPALLRRGREATSTVRMLCATAEAADLDLSGLAQRAPRQAAILTHLLDEPIDAASAPEQIGAGWIDPFRRLVARGLAGEKIIDLATSPRRSRVIQAGPDLTAAQRAAVDEALAEATDPLPLLLFGVTGSGKTEVYLRVLEETLARGSQALVLVPEIGLTPQIVRRIRRRFDCEIAVLHSGLSEKERFEAWMSAQSGRASLVVGTRSAVFVPMPDCGLIVVDEEHDPSFKQQEGFRYSARDLAVVRARRAGIPVILGSATPALETMRNAELGRYRRVDLPERPGASSHPRMRVVDLRSVAASDGLATTLLAAMQRHLEAGDQVMLFLNRRGYATAMFCSACGWTADCPRCDSRMTLHQRPYKLRCHHCGRQTDPPSCCADCETELKPVGQGTERIEETLEKYFPDMPVARLDRDSAHNADSLKALLEDMRSGATRILIGTQMLTKGHDFPGVTLVGVLNADQGLFGTDFRSDERLAQTILQVSGRAGRRERPGEVLLQTSYPQHPLLERLIDGGYADFAAEALAERSAARWPPFSHLALLRAEAHDRSHPADFLSRCAHAVESSRAPHVSVLGPAPSPMERRSGRYRAQLLMQSPDRRSLHVLIDNLLERIDDMPEARRVRWSLDVDPVELF
jgi:primosomal protein N' (replication factor Y)